MINKEMYNIEKADNVGRDGGLYGSLRVLFREELIGVVQNYSDANDVIEEHAANYKPTVTGNRKNIMKDESDLKAIIDSLRKHNDELLAGMRELEQENMDKEDENAALLQRLLVSREETYVAIDAERLRAWKENKAFQYDLAEQNAELRKQLGEKHDDNARLQRLLAEENRKLLDALESKEDLSASTLSATVRMSNAEVANDDLHAQLERLNSMVETLWEERRVGNQVTIWSDDPDYFVREIDDTGGTGLVYKIETDQEAVRFTASNGTYNDHIELPLGITYDLLAELHDNSRF